MKQRSLFAFCLILAIAAVAAAQSKSVTNADLERFRQERVKSERDYSENYERMGLPSPSELQGRRERDRIETAKLSAELRAARLERERLDAERQAAEQRATVLYQSNPRFTQPNTEIFGYYWYGGRRWPIYTDRGRRPAGQEGYFAGGQFWPTGTRIRTRSAWLPMR